MAVKPEHGARRTADDSRSPGPGLSILARVGMLVGVVLFTWLSAAN